MTRTIPHEVDQIAVAESASRQADKITDLRVQTLSTLAALCSSNGLPAPAGVEFYDSELGGEHPHSLLKFVFDDDDVEAFAAWCSHLSLNQSPVQSQGPHRWISANRVCDPLSPKQPVWLGWHEVEAIVFLHQRDGVS